MLSKSDYEFSFAGFDFPKFVWTLPRGSFAKRIDRMKNPCTGEYYHMPKPLRAGDNGMGFYLDSDGMPALRWQWADDVCHSIRHTGWFTDEYGDSEKIRGVVFRLPHSRGFLAGWSMGVGMASALEYYVYSDERSAALAADSFAERVAEDEREYQAKNQGVNYGN